MDKLTPKVLKSKSSNSAGYTKTNRYTKSKSNAEFMPKVLKKRGKYVEKQITKTVIDDPVNNPSKQKAPRRPRPGSKSFLTSVLTILSKSTTGTQHPELDNTKFSKTRKTNQEAPIENRTKRKYKSRILNKQNDKLIVLQSNKVINTPSIYSEISQDTIKTTMPKFAASALEQRLDNSIEDVKKGRKNKKVTIDEPETLVQDKNDPALYNFFVDLLKSTFSESNKNKQNTELKNLSISKINLAIKESVANKLNVYNETKSRVTEKVSNFYAIAENCNDIAIRNCMPHLITFSKIDLLPKQRNVKKKQPELLGTKVIISKAYNGLFSNKKSCTAKNKKKIVLNFLKKELQMDVNAYLEPQNLYQALRNIAMNKKNYQKFTRFTKIQNSNECIFKQKKVISPNNTRKRVDTNSKSTNLYTNNYYNALRHIRKYPSDESKHSLQVFDFDYEM